MEPRHFGRLIKTLLVDLIIYAHVQNKAGKIKMMRGFAVELLPFRDFDPLQQEKHRSNYYH